MAQVKLLDFAVHLEQGELYYFWPEANSVKVYSEEKKDSSNMVLAIPYTSDEWREFLKNHNCDLERGDYEKRIGDRCKNKRAFHREKQDELVFEISHGGVVHGEMQPDIIWII